MSLTPLCASLKMLDTVWPRQPGVLVLLVDRHAQLRELEIGKGTDRHGNESRQGVDLPEHDGAALGAKLELRGAAALADTDELFAPPRSSPRPRRTAPARRTRCACVSDTRNNGR
jgi:hypothetical protein